MGNYATQADLKGRYSDDREVAALTLDEETGTPSTAVLDEVIEDAEGEAESYISERYSVPVDVSGGGSLAARLKSVVLDLACMKLELRQGFITEARQKAWDLAIEWLGRVRDGKALLPKTTAPASSTSRASVARFGSAGTDRDTTNRLFTRATQETL